MSAYVFSVIGVVLLSAVLSCIIPEGKTSGIIKGVAKMACIAVIVSPILQFFQSGKNPALLYKNSQEIFSQSGIETDEAFIQYYSEMRIAQTQTLLQDEVLQKFGVRTGISLEWIRKEKENLKLSSDEIYITKIMVTGMEKESETLKNTVKEYLTKNYCSEVQIE